jgi:polyisoprenoid-binding protein YceI
MSRFSRLFLSFFAAVLLLSARAQAELKPYVPDRSHGQINFVGDALLISAHGFFERWDGEFQIDREKLENSKIKLTIDAASLNTRVEGRDKHLRSADFLDVAKFPQITFVSTKVAKVDDSNYKVTGELSLKGVTRSVDLPVKVVFLRETDGRFRGEIQLNRKDYGMTYNSRMNPIEDMVAVQFDLHLVDKQAMEERQRQRQQQPQPAPTP